jgi:hypothetical protein
LRLMMSSNFVDRITGRQPIERTLCEARFDRHVLAVDETSFF